MVITEAPPNRVWVYNDDGFGNLILDPLSLPLPLAAPITITNITQTNPARVTVAAYPYIVGQMVRIENVIGMSEVNNANYTVTPFDATQFDINFDGTTASSYVTGGDVNFVGTINYATGALNVYSDILISPYVISYSTIPCLPVMGLSTRETDTINFEQLIAFDTRRANLYSNTLNQFIDISAGTSWNGTNSDFFWTTNYAGDAAGNRLFWATNNVEVDGIKYYNGTIWITQAAVIQVNAVPPDVELKTCLILLPYKDRLVALNTVEGDVGGGGTRFPQRARWSQNATPVTAIQADAWQQDIVGKGAFLDAPTEESIVSAEFIRDTLIVFFERSTYRLAYTGNNLLPFVWEKINTELGAESTFSVTPFDNGVFAVGDKGIITANSNTVTRIDEKIPDVVFSLENENSGPQRVHGIRDYRREMVFWTFPPFNRDNGGANNIFPSKVLAFNYKDGAYSFFTASFTTFGTLQVSQDRTWATSIIPWASATFPWNDPINQARFPLIVAGNQQGFVFSLEENIKNSKCLKIDLITQALPAQVTSTNHNFNEGDIIEFVEVQGMTEINDMRAEVREVIDNDNFTLSNIDGEGLDSTGFGAYTAGGNIVCVFNFLAKTKRFNPFIEDDLQITVPYMDMYVDNTTNGEFTLKAYVDSNDSTPMPNLMTGESDFTVSTAASQSSLGTTVQDQIIQRVFVRAEGQFVQFEFSLDREQMFDTDIQASNVTLQAIILTAEPHGRLV